MRESLSRPAPLLPDAERAASQARLDELSAAAHPHCLLCGASDMLGTRLKFTVQNDGSVLATVPCRERLQSYPDTLHGGVIAALLDAAMTHALFATGVVALTAELTVRFLSPVAVNRGVVLHAWIERTTTHELYYVRSELWQQGRVMARASARFVDKGLRAERGPSGPRWQG